MENINNDLEFNIEEVQEAVACQADDTNPQDTFTIGGHGVSCSRKIWCC